MGLLSHLTALLLAAATASSSLIPAAAAAAASAAAASPSPRISSISFSGNGCPKDPKHSGGFTDPTFTYHGFALALPGANRTANCQVHVQATTGAGAAGWQVALRTNSVRGHVVLSPGTRLEYYTSVFFSQEAGKTVCFFFFFFSFLPALSFSSLDYPSPPLDRSRSGC